MYKYKTKNGQNGFIPNVGVIVNGVIESEQPIENPNIELISDEQPVAPASGVVGVAPTVSPNAVSPETPVSPATPINGAQ